MITGSPRVLPARPWVDLAAYVAAGGGAALAAARAVTPDVVIAEITASGLRGRGGAGFPTGVKWATVRSYASPVLDTWVVVNAAEGEPGTFKDRAILAANPYAVLEGALIAARAVEARTIVIALKATATETVARVRRAADEARAAGWTGDVEIVVAEGPSAYLFGEETALLEVLDGRPPFPRIAPPYRRGVVEVVANDAAATSGSGLAAPVQFAELDDGGLAPPVLVDNVETLANVPGIVERGAAWFREVGTHASPGTIVCTITGDVTHPGVAEIPMGTTLREAIEEIGGGVADGRPVAMVLVGVSAAPIGPEQLDTPLTYEAMAAIGSALGSAGYIVLDDHNDPVGVAAGVSRFLAVESCGQCTPCKWDGLDIAAVLQRLAEGRPDPGDDELLTRRLATVADGARCSLGRQHQTVIGELLDRWRPSVEARFGGGAPVDVTPIAELIGLDETGATIDPTFADKQPDWTNGGHWGGAAPAELDTDHRAASHHDGAPRSTTR